MLTKNSFVAVLMLMVLPAIVLCSHAVFAAASKPVPGSTVISPRDMLIKVSPVAMTVVEKLEGEGGSQFNDDELMATLRSRSFAEEYDRSHKAFCAKPVNANLLACVARKTMPDAPPAK
jgi:hypothetical protein